MADPNVDDLPDPRSARRPDPDPTALTTQALYREVAALKALVELRIEGVQAMSSERVVRIEQQFDLIGRDVRAQLQGLRDVLDSDIRSITALRDAKLHEVALQFELVEKQRIEQKNDTKSAVDAALIAQKEAVREQTVASEKSIQKSETAVTKQLEQLAATFSAAEIALRRSIDEVKERMSDETRLLRASITESDRKANGVAGAKVGSGDTRAFAFAIVAAMVGVIGIVLAVVGFFVSRGGS